MPARLAAHADPNEFVNSTMRSNAPALSVAMSAVRTGDTSCSSLKIASTDAGPTIVTSSSANTRRNAAIAGSAITASPSQFGARRAIRIPYPRQPLFGDLFSARRREHAGHRRNIRRKVAPAAVHPEPEIGITAHVHLEHVGAA